MPIEETNSILKKKEDPMIVHRKFYLFVVIVGLIVTACAPGIGAAPAATSIPATTVPANTAIPSPMPTASPSGPTSWSLVVVGDSIPFNSPEDCPGCTGFVDRYAKDITVATGHPVKVQNLSQHTGLQTDSLLEELKTDTQRREALANADIIIVSIGHNDTAWNRGDDPCDGSNNEDWSKYNKTCAAAAAEIFRPQLESIFAQIVSLRAGKPTILRAVNVYNDWIGVSGTPPEATDASRISLDAWSAMICQAAKSNGFTCADIYHAFNGSDGHTPAVDLLAQDTVHPSDKGNEVIAKVLTDLRYTPLVP
jgi:lysophospholipase L1-like esterase